ncbi:hypothetical protein HU751_022530 [Pseudomonas sp. BW13M1]|uniref:Phage abortive infection protein n=1 Tax=Pseudomonas peradeniyensis TaxID=2745488 RepID=A0A923GA45_9PSED|nr:hypothetical protein [Pseudomonas peradeniyensis]MBV4507613.1 hypothetical protein [Pseudomonas peradeniyensis]
MNLYVEIFLGFVFVSISVHALHLTFFSGVKEVQRDVSPLNSTFIISLALAVAVVVLIAFIILGKSDLAISSNIGQVGDFIGGLLNPVLSFLALLVLLRTTLIQTNEAKKTTAFMATQQGIMEREKFENTFFQLVGRLDDYAEVLFRSETDRSKRYAYQLRQKLVKKRDEFDLMSWKAGVDASAEYVRGIIAGDFDRLNGFARKASHCLYFIDGSGITPDEKNSIITTLLRSFISMSIRFF